MTQEHISKIIHTYQQREAFAAARARVLASGQSVLQSEGGFIVRVFPDGRKQRIKPVEEPTPVTPGTTFTIR